MAKEACVLVLDIGRHVSAEDLEAGKNAVRMLVQQKLLFTKRDELGLLLVGTQGTNDGMAGNCSRVPSIIARLRFMRRMFQMRATPCTVICRTSITT
jgi:hypothetical protein